MCKIISIANQKGGVGKTTTAVNIAASLSLLGKRVALLDLDPQGNATLNVGIDPDGIDKTIYSVLIGNHTLQEVIIETKFNIDVIPSNDDLSELDMVIFNNRDYYPNPANTLSNALQCVLSNYDYIIIDCPPSKGLLTINALTASTDVIIVMQCEYFATKGVNKILDTVKKVQDNYNPSLNLLGIADTMFISGTNLSTVVLQEARKFFMSHDIQVFDTVVNRTVRFGQSPMQGVPAVIAYPELETIQSYMHLTREVFEI